MTSTGGGAVVSRKSSSWPGPSASNAASTVARVGGDDDRVLRRAGVVVLGPGDVGDDAVEAVRGRGRSIAIGDVDAQVADLAQVEALELGLA